MNNLSSSNFYPPYNREYVARAKKLRKTMTPAEQKLRYEFLKTFQFRVLRQRPIDYFIVDFYCAHLKLVIEVDGAGHFTEQGQKYDQQRTQRLESYGLKVIRFTNQQVLEDFESVCQTIQATVKVPLEKGDLGGAQPSPAANMEH